MIRTALIALSLMLAAPAFGQTRIRFEFDPIALEVDRPPGQDAINRHMLGRTVAQRERTGAASGLTLCTVTFVDSIPEPALTGLVNAIKAAPGVDVDTVEVL